MPTLRRLLVVLLLAAARRSSAQDGASLTGVVQDAASGRRLIGAIVAISGADGSRTARTDETGGFIFTRLKPGTYRVSVRHLGYEPASQSASVPQDARITVTMNRLAALDTVRVRAAKQAIYGVVARARDLTPLRGATVQVFGSTVGNATTDSTGHFFYVIQKPGAYLVRAAVRNYSAQTVSLTVTAREGVEVALLLDSTEAAGANMLAQAYDDFRERILRRPLNSVIVPRTELLSHGNGGVVSNVMLAQSFALKGLHFSDAACLYVDGQPKPGVSANSIEAASVEAVEVYGKSGSATLTQRWPPGAPCGMTGQPSAGSAKTPRAFPGAPEQRTQTDIVYWVVVWLKH